MARPPMHIPPKRVDADTLQNRLTDNAYDRILPARYLQHDRDGARVEEPEDLFRRVGQNVAVAEAVWTDEDVLITPNVIKPDHPRRDELINDVFPPRVVDEETGKIAGGQEVPLTEKNAKWVAYDPLVEHLEDNGYESTLTMVREMADTFTEQMEYLSFIPNSPTMMNAGGELQQLSACFVNSPEDDMESIHDTAKEAALTFQSGGGMGYAFWRLRPYGDSVGSTGGIASGPITFMHTYDQMCETIAQGGTRRGAQMAIMRVSHPDVLQFIHAKNKDVSLAETLRLNDPDDYRHTSFGDALGEARDLMDDGKVPDHLRNAAEGHLSNFNISVGITEEFMDAVKADAHYTFTNPRTGEHHIATEETKELYDWFGLGEYVTVGEPLTVPAGEVWERIVDGAHENGEPGVVFLDRINDEHSFPTESTPTAESGEYEILATNPSLRAGTKVLTDKGIMPIEELEDEEFVTVNRNGESAPAECFLSSESETLYEVELSTGKSFYATAEHKWPVASGRGSGGGDFESKASQYARTRTDSLQEDDYLPITGVDEIPSGDMGSGEEGFLAGWFYGDGSVTMREDGRRQYGLTVSKEDAECGVLDKLLNILEDVARYRYSPTERRREGEPWYEVHATAESLRDRMAELGVTDKEDGLPDILWQDASEEFRRGFIDGLFSADGCVSDSQQRVTLTTSREEIASDVRDLLSFYGIKTAVDYSEVDNDWGEFERYDVRTSADGSERFGQLFELTHSNKQSRLEEMEGSSNMVSSHVQVESVTKTDMEEPVWDISVYDQTNTFALAGCVTGNCGEQPLMEYEACNLGHINLSTIVAEDAPDWRTMPDPVNDEDVSQAVFDFLAEAIEWGELYDRVQTGTRFLDNVVTMSDFPIPEIEETVRQNRKIGLGIMGLAQLYVQLGVKYGSDVANEIARQLMQEINHESKSASCGLAEDRGSFANWPDSKYADPLEYSEWFHKQTGVQSDGFEDGFPMRNHNTTTIAPTGTTSMVANTSGGCEPIYNVIYRKNVSQDVQGEEMLAEADDYFLRVLEANDIDSEAVLEEADRQMRNNEFEGIDSLDPVPNSLKELFVTTSDLTALEHASVQCALQDGVDSSISKTINAPNEATIEDAEEAFEYIYDNGGKGVTYYRDGTRAKQVLTTRDDNQSMDDELTKIPCGCGDFSVHVADTPDSIDAVCPECNNHFGFGSEDRTSENGTKPRPRPKVTSGETHRISTGYGTMYVTINEDEYGLHEVFATIGKSGGFTESMVEALARQVSLSLRVGADVDEVIDQLDNIQSPQPGWDQGEQIQSIPDGIATALKRYQGTESTPDEEAKPVASVSADGAGDGVSQLVKSGENPECVECGALLTIQEGCEKCPECGWSKC